MGVATSLKGKIYVIDDKKIMNQNLTSQFLFKK